MIDTFTNMGTLGIVMMIASFIFWGWALVDILKSNFKEGINKLIWLLVVFFLYALGALLYVIIGRKQKS